MFNGQREQHAQRPRGRARSQTGQGATDAGGGGRLAGALGFTGKAARGRQRRGSKYGPIGSVFRELSWKY